MERTPERRLEDLKVTELRSELKRLGLPSSGVKSALIERLRSRVEEEKAAQVAGDKGQETRGQPEDGQEKGRPSKRGQERGLNFGEPKHDAQEVETGPGQQQETSGWKKGLTTEEGVLPVEVPGFADVAAQEGQEEGKAADAGAQQPLLGSQSAATSDEPQPSKDSIKTVEPESVSITPVDPAPPTPLPPPPPPPPAAATIAAAAIAEKAAVAADHAVPAVDYGFAATPADALAPAPAAPAAETAAAAAAASLPSPPSPAAAPVEVKPSAIGGPRAPSSLAPPPAPGAEAEAEAEPTAQTDAVLGADSEEAALARAEQGPGAGAGEKGLAKEGPSRGREEEEKEGFGGREGTAKAVKGRLPGEGVMESVRAEDSAGGAVLQRGAFKEGEGGAPQPLAGEEGRVGAEERGQGRRVSKTEEEKEEVEDEEEEDEEEAGALRIEAEEDKEDMEVEEAGGASVLLHSSARLRKAGDGRRGRERGGEGEARQREKGRERGREKEGEGWREGERQREKGRERDRDVREAERGGGAWNSGRDKARERGRDREGEEEREKQREGDSDRAKERSREVVREGAERGKEGEVDKARDDRAERRVDGRSSRAPPEKERAAGKRLATDQSVEEARSEAKRSRPRGGEEPSSAVETGAGTGSGAEHAPADAAPQNANSSGGSGAGAKDSSSAPTPSASNDASKGMSKALAPPALERAISGQGREAAAAAGATGALGRSLSSGGSSLPPTPGAVPASGSFKRVLEVPASQEPRTCALRIDNFVRPFTQKQVQELLGLKGVVSYFWMDNIRTHCYVLYESVEEASLMREELYGIEWPRGGKALVARFVPVDDVLDKQYPSRVIKRQQEQEQAGKRAQQQQEEDKAPAGEGVEGEERGGKRAREEEVEPRKERGQVVAGESSGAGAGGAGEAAQPPLVRKEGQAPAGKPMQKEDDIPTLDDLFRKTKAKPQIYFLPLTAEQVAAKMGSTTANGGTQQGHEEPQQQQLPSQPLNGPAPPVANAAAVPSAAPVGPAAL